MATTPDVDHETSNSITRRQFLGATLAAGGGLAFAGQRMPRLASAQAHQAPLQGTLSVYDHQSLSYPGAKKFIAEYEKLRPGVKIEIVSGPPGGIDTYITTLMAGGSPPDLFVVADNTVPWQNVKDNWWVDLTPYAHKPDPFVPGNRAWVDLVKPGVIPTLLFRKGQMYSLTTTGFDVAFFYNKDIYQKLHVDPPTEWWQMVEAFKKFKAAGYIPFFCCLGEVEIADETQGLWLILQDTVMNKTIDRLRPSDPSGTITVDELVRGIKDGIYSPRSADYQEVWRLFKSLRPYMQNAPAGAISSAQGLAAFETGRVATWFEGSFNAPSIKRVNWGAFVTPTLTSRTTSFATKGPQRKGAYGALAGYPWCVPVHTVHKGKLDLAMDFIYWLSAPKQTEVYATENGVIPLDRTSTNPPEIAPFVEAASNVSRVSAAELALPQPFFTNKSKLVEAYVLGQVSLDSAMSQMQQMLDTAANQAIKEFGL